ncbi:MAG: addiction module protein, partial [Candidatus Binataceae bacterium]
ALFPSPSIGIERAKGKSAQFEPTQKIHTRLGTSPAPRYRATDQTALTSLPMANSSKILPGLLKLPARERARLATELVQSLDETEDPDAAEAWLEELDRRAREVTSGTATVEDWTRVRRRIELRLRAR